MITRNFRFDSTVLSSPVAGIVCALLVFLFFSPVLNFEFVNWDDDLKVYNNIHIQQLDRAFIQWAFTEVYQASYHPLTWLSHAIDYRLWGLDARGHHLSNLLLHCLNVYLVFCFTLGLQSMLKRRHGEVVDNLTNAYLLPVVVSLLFGLHPAQVESVAWVTARKDVLYTAFSLLSLIAYCRHVDRARLRPAMLTLPYCLAIFCFFCAVASKPTAIVLPAFYLMLDCYPGERLRSSRDAAGLLAEKIPLFLIAAWITYMTIHAHLANQFVLSGLSDISLLQRISNASYFVGNYLRSAFWPFNLTPFHPFSRTVHLTTGELLASILAVSGITALAVWRIRQAPFLLALWLFFLLGLSPTLGLVHAGQQLYADRYAYFSNYAIYVLVAVVMLKGWDAGFVKNRLVYRAGYLSGIGILLALLLWQTQLQIRVWENGLSLWANVVEKKPQMVDPYKNYGNSLLTAGRYQEAVKSYTTGLELAPADPDLLNNLAVARLDLGEFDAAASVAMRALQIHPGSARALNTLGEILLHKGDYDKSLQYFQRAVQQEGITYITAFNLALAYEQLGELSQACRYLQEYVKISPSADDGREKYRLLDCATR